MLAAVRGVPTLAPSLRTQRPNPERIRNLGEYAELKRRVAAAGLLEAQPAYYWMKTIVAVATLAGVVFIALTINNPIILMLDAVLFGIATTQMALLAHDAGHRQLCRSRMANLAASVFFGNLMLGVSFSWWVTKHNQHHATPNHIDDDPDVNFPMLVFSPDQISSRRHWLLPVIAFQAYIFIFLLPLQAIAMRVNSVLHLLQGKPRLPWLQAAGMAVHFALFALLLVALPSWQIAVGFALISQITFGLYNSSVFASNHKGMAIIKPGERMDFLHEQVLTSRNVDGHRFTDFWYGGLNYQIEHHLFPTMPRNRLGEAQLIVRDFCEEHEIPYCSTSLFSSYRAVLSHLNRVSAPLRGG